MYLSNARCFPILTEFVLSPRVQNGAGWRQKFGVVARQAGQTRGQFRGRGWQTQRQGRTGDASGDCAVLQDHGGQTRLAELRRSLPGTSSLTHKNSLKKMYISIPG